MKTITIPKKLDKEKEEDIVIPRQKYEKMKTYGIPTLYLKGKAAEKLERRVTKALKDYKEGKTIEASSLEEALKIYERRRK